MGVESSNGHDIKKSLSLTTFIYPCELHTGISQWNSLPTTSKCIQQLVLIQAVKLQKYFEKHQNFFLLEVTS